MVASSSISKGSAVNLNFNMRLFVSSTMVVAFSYSFQAGAQTLEVLHHFKGSDGQVPIGGLALDSAGKIYGTTSSGGKHGQGTLFRMDPMHHSFKTLHHFKGGKRDGAGPHGEVMIDASGDLYGTTYGGGPAGAGTVFRLAGAKTYQVLTALDGVSLRYLNSGVLKGADGTLYAAAEVGNGPYGTGSVFSMKAPGYVPAIVHTFTYDYDSGGKPESTPIFFNGQLHGTGRSGGMYAVDVDGQNFSNAADDWWDSVVIMAGMTPGDGGVLWGVQQIGDIESMGQIYRIDPDGTYHDVFEFFRDDEAYGFGPRGTLVLAPDGVLFGSTYSGGRLSDNEPGDGVIFSFDPASGTFQTPYVFSGKADGGRLFAGLLADGHGAYYGVTATGGKFNDGTLFKFTP